MLILVVAFGVVTARLLVWPARGMPHRVSAIVMLAGPGDRLNAPLELARQYRAPTGGEPSSRHWSCTGAASPGIGDEGGFAPDLEHNRAALDLIVEAIGKGGFTPGQDAALAIDAAASEFYAAGAYHYEVPLICCRVLCTATHRGVIT